MRLLRLDPATAFQEVGQDRRDVRVNFHRRGQAIYDALVRLAQYFSSRYR